ncbi:MOSC domain-containing protein [Rubrivivax gelatinosus]|nr:MOSC domain-containing protein [Rubrivivax gelatinosus]
MSDLDCRVSQLFVHPVKSCAGIDCDEALLVETGLDLDRAWMLASPDGRMLTQRQLPRLALVRPTLGGDELVLRAPGMLALHLPIDGVDTPTRATVWEDEVAAWDLGALAAQWFADFLGQPARLLRFDPDQRRLSSARWSAGIEAENLFSDGFPILVASSSSLAELNRRLAARGQAAVGMERFRPNLVLDGLEPFDEDHVDEITITTDDGPVRLKLVKPCVRCSIPNVDPASAETGVEPGATLAQFRADARMDGGITFGMNAVIVEGFGRRLCRGQVAAASWAF